MFIMPLQPPLQMHPTTPPHTFGPSTKAAPDFYTNFQYFFTFALPFYNKYVGKFLVSMIFQIFFS